MVGQFGGESKDLQIPPPLSVRTSKWRLGGFGHARDGIRASERVPCAGVASAEHYRELRVFLQGKGWLPRTNQTRGPSRTSMIL